MDGEPERSFEEIYRELEDTVRRLESGSLTLAESLALFERGTLLAAQCSAYLDRAELRVRQLIAQPDGTIAETPFDTWQNDGSP